MLRIIRIAALGAGLTLVGALAYRAQGRSEKDEPRQVAPSVVSAVPRAPAPGTIEDPLDPGSPAIEDSSRPLADDWVKARPGFQSSRTAAERGGTEPCATQPTDTSAYTAWQPLGRGRYALPSSHFTTDAGGFDLIIHLHGEEPVLRELVESKERMALYTLTLPPEQGYAPLFSGTQLYEHIISDMEEAVGKVTGKAAHVQHVALSAWSAGFVGVEAVLAQSQAARPDAVLLVDGLHAPRGDTQAFEAQLAPFVQLAKRAASGDGFFFVSHSSIDPPDFASTTECAHYLIDSVGGRPLAVKREGRFGLELVEYFSRGNLHVRGYAGNDKPDHCAQLALLRDVFRALGRRWASQ